VPLTHAYKLLISTGKHHPRYSLLHGACVRAMPSNAPSNSTPNVKRPYPLLPIIGGARLSLGWTSCTLFGTVAYTEPLGPAKSCMDSRMDSHISSLNHAWIHVWIHAGLTHGFTHGFVDSRMDSRIHAWIHAWIHAPRYCLCVLSTLPQSPGKNSSTPMAFQTRDPCPYLSPEEI
jgi:hypothetical protein